MSDDMVNNLKRPSAWFRVLFMAGFAIALYISGIILLVLMLAQIVFSLLTGEDNVNLRSLGASLTTYVTQILKYLTYNSELKPFPFSEFPAHSAPVVEDIAEPVINEPVINEPVINEPVTTEVDTDAAHGTASEANVAGTAEEAQAVADDDGFQNPPASTDTQQAQAAAEKRAAARTKDAHETEVPPPHD